MPGQWSNDPVLLVLASSMSDSEIMCFGQSFVATGLTGIVVGVIAGVVAGR